jgi:hypothetical protein
MCDENNHLAKAANEVTLAGFRLPWQSLFSRKQFISHGFFSSCRLPFSSLSRKHACATIEAL